MGREIHFKKHRLLEILQYIPLNHIAIRLNNRINNMYYSKIIYLKIISFSNNNTRGIYKIILLIKMDNIKAVKIMG